MRRGIGGSEPGPRAREAKRRGAGRAPGRTPAPRACGAERRRPPPRWSRRGNGGSEPGPRAREAEQRGVLRGAGQRRSPPRWSKRSRGFGGSEPGPWAREAGRRGAGRAPGRAPAAPRRRRVTRSGAGTAAATVVEERDRWIRAGPTGPRSEAARRPPRSGAETAAATVVEERDRGSGPGPRAREASGEARAAHRVGPRRRRRALAERGPTGRALAEQRLRARLGLASLLSQRGGRPRLLTVPRSRAVSTRCRPKVGLATPNHKEMRAEALTVKNSH